MCTFHDTFNNDQISPLGALARLVCAKRMAGGYCMDCCNAQLLVISNLNRKAHEHADQIV